MGYGMTIPFDGIPLADHRSWLEELVDLGYTDVWSSEADGTDAFTPLALAAAWTPTLRLGTAIVPTFTRGPALVAQSAAAMAEAAPGRFALGVGTSSDVIVSRWNGIPFEEPYKRTRDMVRFLRAALAGEKVDQQYDTFTVKGFKLARPPAVAPPVLVAALRPGMLRLAGREGDGAIINWLGAGDVAKVVREVGPGKEVVARIFAFPTEDRDAVRLVGRRMVAAYLNVPVYAAFHEWLGRGSILADMWALWKAGDRKAALEAIPDQVVDDLVLSGSPAQVKEKVQAYVDAGVTTPALMIVPFGLDLKQMVRELAP
ncbi:MAG TPA: LLM class F420-dependent oxidoreductase [Acidimicrobiales bacterium]|jgi:probable F420-dependent oxidoreductase|nr:LLM class F420-dependent oxidoreductase [Acidimicrobiales bacterium]